MHEADAMVAAISALMGSGKDIVLAADVSGTIQAEAVESFSIGFWSLARNLSLAPWIALVGAKTEVRELESIPYRIRPTQVEARGGLDWDGAFKAIKEAGLNPAIVVVLTDRIGAVALQLLQNGAPLPVFLMVVDD